MENRYKIVKGTSTIKLLDTYHKHLIASFAIKKAAYATKCVTFLNIEHEIEQEEALSKTLAS